MWRHCGSTLRAGIDPVPVAKHSPQLGESVEIWGYGPKRFRSFLATVSRRPITLTGDVPQSLVGAQGVKDKQSRFPATAAGR